MAKKMSSGSVLSQLLGDKTQANQEGPADSANLPNRLESFDDQLIAAVKSFMRTVGKIGKQFSLNPADSPAFGIMSAWAAKLVDLAELSPAEMDERLRGRFRRGWRVAVTPSESGGETQGPSRRSEFTSV